jgi:hypothetical protein
VAASTREDHRYADSGTLGRLDLRNVSLPPLFWTRTVAPSVALAAKPATIQICRFWEEG